MTFLCSGWSSVPFSRRGFHCRRLTQVVLLVTGGGEPRGKGLRKFSLAQTLRDVGVNQGSGGEGERLRRIQGKSGRGLVVTRGHQLVGRE